MELPNIQKRGQGFFPWFSHDVPMIVLGFLDFLIVGALMEPHVLPGQNVDIQTIFGDRIEERHGLGGFRPIKVHASVFRAKMARVTAQIPPSMQ